MGKFSRRTLLLGSGAVLGAVGSKTVFKESIPTGAAVPAPVTGPGRRLLNDASQLSPTRVAKHIIMRTQSQKTVIARLREELNQARQEGRPLVASAARHSMGGQSLAGNCTAMTFDQNRLELDRDSETYRVPSGMRWSRVVRALDAKGFSPKVMQSNNDFATGSSFCVNAHGWPVPYSAVGSTVRSISLMLADGEVITCSRTENAEQFNLAMGGYGLNGIVLELDIEMVPNMRLVPNFEVMPALELGQRFVSILSERPDIQMAYGRLDVTIDGFFQQGILVTFEPDKDQQDLPEVASSGLFNKFSREVLRGQLGSDRMKSLRWLLETKAGPWLAAPVTRNRLINEPVVTLEDRDPDRTDILHEYFVPPDRFAEFIQACRDIIPSSFQELLNITLRYVATDTESVLRYAPQPRIAAVMLFSQEMSTRSELDMQRMTRALIERVLEIGGTYYLPYRLHASDDQFRRAYPTAEAFVNSKRRIDPDLIFRNRMWDQYMAKI